MALFDQLGAAQAGNGQAVPPNPPPQTSGAPGFNPGSWGNQPPNLAGGLQQFMQGMGGNPLMARLQAAMQQNPQLAHLFGGGPQGIEANQGQAGPFGVNPGQSGAGPFGVTPSQSGPPPGGAVMATPGAMQNQMGGGAPPAPGAMGGNFAGGLRGFLGR